MEGIQRQDLPMTVVLPHWWPSRVGSGTGVRGRLRGLWAEAGEDGEVCMSPRRLAVTLGGPKKFGDMDAQPKIVRRDLVEAVVMRFEPMRKPRGVWSARAILQFG